MANGGGPRSGIARPGKFKGKNQPQDYWCYPGQVLIACVDNTKKLINGCVYQVTKR